GIRDFHVTGVQTCALPILIRHTRVTASGLCYGRLDVPLAASFAEEARAVRKALAHQFPEGLPAIWSSPSLRCRSLAEALDAPFRSEERRVGKEGRPGRSSG